MLFLFKEKKKRQFYQQHLSIFIHIRGNMCVVMIRRLMFFVEVFFDIIIDKFDIMLFKINKYYLNKIFQ